MNDVITDILMKEDKKKLIFVLPVTKKILDKKRFNVLPLLNIFL